VIHRDAALGLPARIALSFGVLGLVACDAGEVPNGFARATGRLEAEEIHVATKLSGRVAAVLVDEGDPVEAGQVLARMDTEVLDAELARAEARLGAVREQSEAAAAVLVQRKSECRLAEKEYERALALHRKDVVSEQRVDEFRTRVETGEAACDAARAQIRDAEAQIEAERASVSRIRADLGDLALEAPTSGRVQYRLAEPGEVLAAGGHVVTLLDLSDVTMRLFLPTAEAGRAAIDAPARVILDARPDMPLPARVSFVAQEAQFTPKEVETKSVREKLSFRVEVKLEEPFPVPVHPGAPGVAWIQLDQDAEWPATLW